MEDCVGVKVQKAVIKMLYVYTLSITISLDKRGRDTAVFKLAQ